MIDSQHVRHLAPHDYPKARSLFEGIYCTLVIDGVLAGNSPAALWVDDPAQPSTALMWDNAYIIYVVGDAGNHAFNQQLGELFTTQLVPAARERGIDGFKIVYGNPAWVSQMATVFPTLTLGHYPRVVYTLGELMMPDWQSQLPPGFTMRRIDRAMLDDTSVWLVADLLEEIEQCWTSVERFLTHGFGYCLMHNQEIVCRCTAEYVSPGKCGIGIATAEPYRQRGFATLTATAFIEHCLAQQIVPYWDAWLRNTASVATAEKVGLRKVQDHWVFVGPLG